MTQKKFSSVDSVAARWAASAFSPGVIDSLLTEAKSSGTPIDGTEGLLAQLTKAVLERALAEEMTEHLGYEHSDPAERLGELSQWPFGQDRVHDRGSRAACGPPGP